MTFYVSQQNLTLTDAQIEAGVRNSRYATMSQDVDADVQATLNYYHGVLQNRATGITISYDSSFDNLYLRATGIVQLLDNTGAVKCSASYDRSPDSVASNNSAVKVHYFDLEGNSLASVDTIGGLPTGKQQAISGNISTATAQVAPKDFAGHALVTSTTLQNLSAVQKQKLEATVGAGKLNIASNLTDLAARADVTTSIPIWATQGDNVDFPGLTGLFYDAAGNIVSASTPGALEGIGATDVYYFYTGVTQTAHVHWIDIADSTKTSGLVPSDGVEKTVLAQDFTGESGDSLNETLTGSLPVHKKIVSTSPGINTATTPYTIMGVYDSDPGVDQDFYIYYGDAVKQKVVYSVADDTAGTTLEDKIVFDSGYDGDTLVKTQADLQAIADGYTNHGYNIVSVNTLPATFDSDETVDQQVTIHLKHQTKETTPTNPGNPGQPVDFSNPGGPNLAYRYR